MVKRTLRMGLVMVLLAGATTLAMGTRARGGDTMSAGGALYAGSQLTSASGQYTLLYQDDGNLVIYGPDGSAIWSTGTNTSNLGEVDMQGDGNFVVYDAGGIAVWSTGTGGNPGAWVIMQDDGNLVVYSASGAALWASGTTR
jgi:hypothetical protein